MKKISFQGLGEKLRRHRKAKNQKQSAVAELAGWESTSNLPSLFEAGRYPSKVLSASKRQELERGYEISLADYEVVEPIEEPPDESSESANAIKMVKLPKPLLDNLVTQFGAEEPDMANDVLLAFLLQKARDLSLMGGSQQLSNTFGTHSDNLRISAEKAIENGDFDGARLIIDQAIDVETDEALDSAKKIAGMYCLKARLYLFEDDVDAAHFIFGQGAHFVSIFNAVDGANLLNAFAVELDNHGWRYNGRSFEYAIEFFEQAKNVLADQGKFEDWAKNQNDLAICLHNQASRLMDNSACELLNRSADSCKEVLDRLTRSEEPMLWARSANNRAIALHNHADRIDEFYAMPLFKEAVSLYEGAVGILAELGESQSWAMAQNNLGVVQRDWAEISDSREARTLLQSSGSAYKASLTVYTMDEFREPWAMVQNNIGKQRASLARLSGAPESTKLFEEARLAFHAALVARDRQRNPQKWAESTENLAYSIESEADFAGGNGAMYEEARALLAEAHKVFSRVYTPRHYFRSSDGLERISKKLNTRV